MNRERRQLIAAQVDELTTLLVDVAAETPDWEAIDRTARSVADEIEVIRADEEAAYDNMPESFQQGERGEQSQAAIEALNSAFDMIDAPPSDDKEDAEQTIQTAIDYLNEAQQ